MIHNITRLLILFTFSAIAQIPDANWIMKKIDDNMSTSNRISEAEMIIHGRRGDRTGPRWQRSGDTR